MPVFLYGSLVEFSEFSKFSGVWPPEGSLMSVLIIPNTLSNIWLNGIAKWSSTIFFLELTFRSASLFFNWRPQTPVFFIDLLSNFRSTFLLFISSFEYLTPLWSTLKCLLFFYWHPSRCQFIVYTLFTELLSQVSSTWPLVVVFPSEEMTDAQLSELAPWSEKLQSIKNHK